MPKVHLVVRRVPIAKVQREVGDVISIKPGDWTPGNRQNLEQFVASGKGTADEFRATCDHVIVTLRNVPLSVTRPLLRWSVSNWIYDDDPGIDLSAIDPTNHAAIEAELERIDARNQRGRRMKMNDLTPVRQKNRAWTVDFEGMERRGPQARERVQSHYRITRNYEDADVPARIFRKAGMVGEQDK